MLRGRRCSDGDVTLSFVDASAVWLSDLVREGALHLQRGCVLTSPAAANAERDISLPRKREAGPRTLRAGWKASMPVVGGAAEFTVFGHSATGLDGRTVSRGTVTNQITITNDRGFEASSDTDFRAEWFVLLHYPKMKRK